MSDHIENAGGKGCVLGAIIIFFLLFIATWASVYYANQDGLGML